MYSHYKNNLNNVLVLKTNGSVSFLKTSRNEKYLFWIPAQERKYIGIGQNEISAKIQYHASPGVFFFCFICLHWFCSADVWEGGWFDPDVSIYWLRASGCSAVIQNNHQTDRINTHTPTYTQMLIHISWKNIMLMYQW